MKKGQTCSDEARRNMSLAHLGKSPSEGHRKNLRAAGIKYYQDHANPMKGKHHSNEAKLKISKRHKGRIVSQETKKKLSEVAKKRGMPSGERARMFGKHHTEETKEKIREKLRGRFVGDKNPAWKGIGGIRKIISRMPEYFEWRTKIFIRDNFTCCDCHERGGILHVHHIVSVREIIAKYNLKLLEEARACKELWVINNGITLCLDCHKRTDSYLNYPGSGKRAVKAGRVSWQEYRV